MGKVIRLPPAQLALPDAVAAVDPAEGTLAGAIRSWVADHGRGNGPLARLLRLLDAAGAHDAAFSVDRMMGILARTAHRVIAIHCPRCPHLSADEKRLLHAARLAQVGESGLAERVLRSALRSAQGAEVALGPLEGLGQRFAEAMLLFRQWRLWRILIWRKAGHPPTRANCGTDPINDAQVSHATLLLDR